MNRAIRTTKPSEMKLRQLDLTTTNVALTARPTNDMKACRSRSADQETIRLNMSLTRRLSAVVLLIVMVPSLVLAAMPVRYCVGPSGHQALEFVIEGVSHGGSHESHERAAFQADDCDTPDSVAAVFADEEKCTDKSLMDTASSPPSVDLKLLPLAGLIAPSFVPASTFSLPSSDQGPASFEPLYRHVDPRVSVRRSVVLLI